MHAEVAGRLRGLALVATKYSYDERLCSSFHHKSVLLLQ